MREYAPAIHAHQRRERGIAVGGEKVDLSPGGEIEDLVMKECTADERAIRSLRDPIDPSVGFLREWYACAVPVDPDFLMKMKVDAAAMPAAIWHGILEGFASTDLTQNAVQITAPVLCIGGSSDPLFGLSHRQALSRAFKSARSIAPEGHGHNPHWEAPQLVAKHLLSFLSEIRGS